MFTETPPFPIHALCSENALLIEYILFVEESRLHNTLYRFHRLLSPQSQFRQSSNKTEGLLCSAWIRFLDK